MNRIVHVVLVQWRPDSPLDVQESVRAMIRALQGSIPGIESIIEGPSVSPEGLEDGLEYGFLITFADAAARDAYLSHPEHVSVADLLSSLAARIVVYDIHTGAGTSPG